MKIPISKTYLGAKISFLYKYIQLWKIKSEETFLHSYFFVIIYMNFSQLPGWKQETRRENVVDIIEMKDSQLGWNSVDLFWGQIVNFYHLRLARIKNKTLNHQPISFFNLKLVRLLIEICLEKGSRNCSSPTRSRLQKTHYIGLK